MTVHEESCGADVVTGFTCRCEERMEVEGWLNTVHAIQVSSQEGMSRSKVKVTGMNRRQKI